MVQFRRDLIKETVNAEEYTINDLYTYLEVRNEVYSISRFTMYIIRTYESTYTVINLFNGTRSPCFKSLDKLITYKLNNISSLNDC